MDLEKGYDKMTGEYGGEKNRVSCVGNLYEGCGVCAKVGREIEYFETKRDFRQGCGILPWFFYIYGDKGGGET